MAEECTNGRWMNNSCICDEGWTGKSDIISFDGYTCQTSVVWEKVVAVILILVNLQLIGDAIRAYKSQYALYRRKKAAEARVGGKLRWIGYQPNQTITFGLVPVPLVLAICIPKLFELEHRVIGRDLVPSVSFILCIPLSFLNSVAVELRAFDALSGTPVGEDELLQWRKKIGCLYRTTTLLYSAVTAVVVLIGCFLPNYDPHSAVMTVALVVRNLSVVVFSVSVYRINLMVNHRIESMLGVLSVDKSKSLQASTRLESFFEFMRKSADGKKKAALVAGVLYLIFLIPPLRGHQLICIFVSTFLAFVTPGHPIRTFIVRSDGKVKPEGKKTSTTLKTSSAPATSNHPSHSKSKTQTSTSTNSKFLES